MAVFVHSVESKALFLTCCTASVVLLPENLKNWIRSLEVGILCPMGYVSPWKKHIATPCNQIQ